jgi:hypothetical protein
LPYLAEIGFGYCPGGAGARRIITGLIVGMVETPGGGSQPKSKKQPHAIAFAPGIEMPIANPERSTVPSDSDAERPLQDAWRNVTGRPER